MNPRGHISDEEYDEIYQSFERCRGKGKEGGPPMFIIAPYNRCISDLDDQQDQKNVEAAKSEKWQQSVFSPEWVVLSRAVHLAKRSHEYMHKCLSNFDNNDWSAIFHETPNAFKSYSVLMRVDHEIIVDKETSSTNGNLEVNSNESGVQQSSFTRSLNARFMGPRALRQNIYRNLRSVETNAVIPGWDPIQSLVASLQMRFGQYAVFFYNELCPEVIGVVWRPHVFVPTTFSALSSDSSCPLDDNWKTDTLVTKNVGDLLRELRQYTKEMVTNIRVFDEACLAHFSKRQKNSHEQHAGEEASTGYSSEE